MQQARARTNLNITRSRGFLHQRPSKSLCIKGRFNPHQLQRQLQTQAAAAAAKRAPYARAHRTHDSSNSQPHALFGRHRGHGVPTLILGVGRRTQGNRPFRGSEVTCCLNVKMSLDQLLSRAHTSLSLSFLFPLLPRSNINDSSS